jgi:hypothetical protein
VLLAIGAAFLVWAAGCTGKTEAPPDGAERLTTETGATAPIDEHGKLYVGDSSALAIATEQIRVRRLGAATQTRASAPDTREPSAAVPAS